MECQGCRRGEVRNLVCFDRSCDASKRLQRICCSCHPLLVHQSISLTMFHDIAYLKTQQWLDSRNAATRMLADLEMLISQLTAKKDDVLAFITFHDRSRQRFSHLSHLIHEFRLRTSSSPHARLSSMKPNTTTKQSASSSTHHKQTSMKHNKKQRSHHHYSQNNRSKHPHTSSDDDENSRNEYDQHNLDIEDSNNDDHAPHSRHESHDHNHNLGEDRESNNNNDNEDSNSMDKADNEGEIDSDSESPDVLRDAEQQLNKTGKFKPRNSGDSAIASTASSDDLFQEIRKFFEFAPENFQPIRLLVEQSIDSIKLQLKSSLDSFAKDALHVDEITEDDLHALRSQKLLPQPRNLLTSISSSTSVAPSIAATTTTTSTHLPTAAIAWSALPASSSTSKVNQSHSSAAASTTHYNSQSNNSSNIITNISTSAITALATTTAHPQATIVTRRQRSTRNGRSSTSNLDNRDLLDYDELFAMNCHVDIGYKVIPQYFEERKNNQKSSTSRNTASSSHHPNTRRHRNTNHSHSTATHPSNNQSTATTTSAPLPAGVTSTIIPEEESYVEGTALSKGAPPPHPPLKIEEPSYGENPESNQAMESLMQIEEAQQATGGNSGGFENQFSIKEESQMDLEKPSSPDANLEESRSGPPTSTRPYSNTRNRSAAAAAASSAAGTATSTTSTSATNTNTTTANTKEMVTRSSSGKASMKPGTPSTNAINSQLQGKTTLNNSSENSFKYEVNLTKTEETMGTTPTTITIGSRDHQEQQQVRIAARQDDSIPPPAKENVRTTNPTATSSSLQAPQKNLRRFRLNDEDQEISSRMQGNSDEDDDDDTAKSSSNPGSNGNNSKKTKYIRKHNERKGQDFLKSLTDNQSDELILDYNRLKNWREVEKKWGISRYHVIKYFNQQGFIIGPNDELEEIPNDSPNQPQ